MGPEIRLYDCCWVELEGYARPELVIQKRLKPRIFIIDEFLYDEAGNALAHEMTAPRILMVVRPQWSAQRRGRG